VGDVAVEVALSVCAEHAEGPIWDADSARLWWVDIAGQRIHRFNPASGEDSSWSTSGQPGGVLIDAAGEPIVLSLEGLAVLDRDSGEPDLEVAIERDKQPQGALSRKSTALTSCRG
jgi:xylono-1,5-lactonase